VKTNQFFFRGALALALRSWPHTAWLQGRVCMRRNSVFAFCKSMKIAGEIRDDRMMRLAQAGRETKIAQA
jgi:hypothetical protein